jgi:hypothetical protein
MDSLVGWRKKERKKKTEGPHDRLQSKTAALAGTQNIRNDKNPAQGRGLAQKRGKGQY